MLIRNWPRRSPSKFLNNTNDGQIRDVLPSRINGVFKCQRCFIAHTVTSELETKLTTFVCRDCRLDTQEWDYAMRNGDNAYTVQSMSMSTPTPDVLQVGEGE